MPLIRCDVNVTYINERGNMEVSWASKPGGMITNVYKLLKDRYEGREIRQAEIELKEGE